MDIFFLFFIISFLSLVLTLVIVNIGKRIVTKALEDKGAV